MITDEQGARSDPKEDHKGRGTDLSDWAMQIEAEDTRSGDVSVGWR
jgi:hypothetical protein